MKMTKIESARIIVKQGGVCGAPIKIKCMDCFANGEKCVISDSNTQDDFDENKVLAAAYIKRHESKTKKPAVKTDVRDMANVVKDETVKESLKVDPTPLDIAKMIRGNNYKCDWNLNLDSYKCEKCPINVESIGGCGSGEDDAPEEAYKLRKTLIDTYISEHEKVDPVMPEPISIEELRKMICFKDEYVYYFNRDEKIGRVNTKHIYEMRITGKHIVMLCGTIVEAENYYKTLADAVRVAESKWGVK